MTAAVRGISALVVVALYGCERGDPRSAAPHLDASAPGPPPTLREASRAGFEEVRGGGRLRAVRGEFEAPPGASAEARAAAFVATHRAALGLPDRVALLDPVVLGTGIQTVVFGLAVDAVPIDAAEVRVRLTEDVVFYVSVNAPASAPVSTTPEIDGSEAERVVAALPDLAIDGSPALVVVEPDLLVGGRGDPALAWRLSTRSSDGHSAPLVYVDARSGTILGINERIVTLTRRTIWDADHLANLEFIHRTSPVYTEDRPPSADAPPSEALTAWQLAGMACDYLEGQLGEDAPCRDLNVYVRYGDTGSQQEEGKLEIAPGDLMRSDGYTVLLHELGHALIHHKSLRTSGTSLLYSYESGAVHESLADVFAMLVTRPARWVIAAGMDGERNLSSPAMSFHPKPAHYDDLVVGVEDSGEVHANSVILSHGLWLATRQGLTVAGARVAPIGEYKAQAIVHHYIDQYLGASTWLQQTAIGLVDACTVLAGLREFFGEDSYGVTFHDCAVVRNALHQVGLAPYADSDLDSWSDRDDNCPSLFNPQQDPCPPEPPSVPDAGLDAAFDASTSRDGGPDVGADDASTCRSTILATGLACPPQFPTSAGDWALSSSDIGESDDCHMTALCRYDDPDRGTDALGEMRFNPDPLVTTWDCGATRLGFLFERQIDSASHQAAAGFRSPNSSADDNDAFAQQLLGLAESFAQPCP